MEDGVMSLNDEFDDTFSVRIGSEDSGSNVRDIVSFDDFSLSVCGKELLLNTALRISHGKRYGLVGPIGTGKSTLLKLLAGRKIHVPKNIDVLLVEQEFVGDDRTAVEAVISANEEHFKISQQVWSSGDNNDDVGEKNSELCDKLQRMGSDVAESQASKILSGLGFSNDMKTCPTRKFIGGWRMRISLARALFVQPTLLLLDEPTNYLNLRALLWLEEYLSKWKNTLVVVSNDRDFLNSVCNEIIYLHDFKLQLYSGNFDAFEAGCEQRRKDKAKLIASKEASKHKGKAKLIASKEASKHKGKSKVADHVKLTREAPIKMRDYTVEFHFPEPTELTPPLLQFIKVSFGLSETKLYRFADGDVRIDMGTRVAIVSSNEDFQYYLGHLLVGSIPRAGEVLGSRELRVERYSHNLVNTLKSSQTPVEYLLHLDPDQEGLSDEEAVRAKLRKFGLPSHKHLIPITKLSGGQKARVVFTSISMSKPHILLLDEPTNHLDMQSIDALADALDEFKGAVFLASHDSRLISRVCEDEERSQIWEVKNGSVKAFQGTFAEYKDNLVKEIRTEMDGGCENV